MAFARGAGSAPAVESFAFLISPVTAESGLIETPSYLIVCFATNVGFSWKTGDHACVSASREPLIGGCLISGGASWPHTAPRPIGRGRHLSGSPQGDNRPVNPPQPTLGAVKSTSKETSDNASVRRRSMLAEAVTGLIRKPPPV